MNVNNWRLFFALLVMNVITLQAQTDTINPKNLSIKGKVKKVEDYSYYLEANSKGTKTIGGKRFNTMPFTEDWTMQKDKPKHSFTNISYEFDKTGKNTNVTTYYAEGKPFGTADFTYDFGGRLVKSQTCFRVSDGDFITHKEYSYDGKKRLVKVEEYEGNQMLETIAFEYDKLGNCIARRKESSFFQPVNEASHQVGSKALPSDRVQEKYTKQEQFQYNSAKKITFSEESFPEHNVFLRIEKEYNRQNKLVKATYLNEEKKETVCTYTYDKNGRLIETVCTAKDDPSFYHQLNTLYGTMGKTEIIKSKRGEVLSKKIFDKNGLLKTHRTPAFDHQYKYTFDAKGNWKEAVLYEQGVPTKVRVRKIQYY